MGSNLKVNVPSLISKMHGVNSDIGDALQQGVRTAKAFASISPSISKDIIEVLRDIENEFSVLEEVIDYMEEFRHSGREQGLDQNR